MRVSKISFVYQKSLIQILNICLSQIQSTKVNFMFRKILKGSLIGGTAIAATAFMFPQRFTPVQKVINVGVAGAQVYYVYKFNSQKSTQQKNAQAAVYLRDALRKNGGLYLKLGQLIATLDVIVPDQYRDIMGTLTRDCPKSSYQKVKLTFQQETGLKIQDFFAQFKKQPISSASIGQVHYAKLKSGQQVAVKVQHRQLSKNVQYDLKLMRFFVSLANKAFQDFKYNWLLEQFQDNIKIELDFQHQAKNIYRLGNFIKRQKLKKLSVPKVILPTTRKILIMQYIKGYHIDEIEQMKKQNIDLRQVGKLFSNLVVKMIHRQGFVHADPHAGNLKVRVNQKNQPQLVILDHGLYQELTPQVKRAYNQFWLGLILNDEKIYDPSARQLGVKNPKILCSMLTSKTQDELNDPNRKLFDLNPTLDRVKVLTQAKNNHQKIVNTLNQLRRQILLLLKVNEFARTIQNMLGGRQFGVYQDIAKQCVDSLDISWWRKYLLYWRMSRLQ